MSHRHKVLLRIASEIREHMSADVTFVGIDGIDGAGKTCFADELAEYLTDVEVIRSSVDGFHNPRALRYAKGRDSPQGFYPDSFNYTLLKRELLDPLRSENSWHYRTSVFDHRTDSPVMSPVREATPPTALLFDGIFLHRPELARYWHYSVFLDVNRRESLRRCNARAGFPDRSDDPEDPAHHRYVEGQRLYVSSCDPAALATRVINNDDLTKPYVVAQRTAGTTKGAA